MTTSLTVLRRRTSNLIKEPFFLDAPTGYFVPTGTSASIIRPNPVMTPFWNTDDYWHRTWIYAATGANAGQERRVSDFVAATCDIYVTPAFSNVFGLTDQLEIHSRSSGTDKNAKINDAIRTSWPFYWAAQTQELVIPADTVELTSTTCTAFPTTWRELTQAWLEPMVSWSDEYTATAGSTSTITVASATWTVNEFAGSRVAITDGAGVGQERTIASNTSTAITFSSVLTTAAASGSIFVIKDPYDTGEWVPINDIAPIGTPYIERVLLPRWLQREAGRTVRFHGLIEPTELSSDSSTTTLPPDYIMNHAASSIMLAHGLDGGSHQWDQEQWLGRWYKERAEQERSRQGFPQPIRTFWRPSASAPTSRANRADNPFWW